MATATIGVLRISMHKKLAWFHRGAESFARVRPGVYSEQVYPCPICLDPLPAVAVADGRLTAEHVPPKSVGGRELVLTCKPCNNTSGTRLDADAKTKERVRIALDGKLSGPERVRARIGGTTLSAELLSENGRYSLRVPAHLYSPGANETLLRIGKAGASLTVQSIPYAELGAKISWLRSGYLALFAVRGYEFALDPALDVVRRQIIECGARKMVTFTSELSQDLPFTQRLIATVLEPSSHGGSVVMFGRYVLHFPAPGDMTFYERLAARADGQEHLTTCRNVGWPTEPTFGLSTINTA